MDHPDHLGMLAVENDDKLAKPRSSELLPLGVMVLSEIELVSKRNVPQDPGSLIRRRVFKARLMICVMDSTSSEADWKAEADEMPFPINS